VRAALEEQLRHLTVQDVLLQTVVTLVNLGARKLGLTAPPEEAASGAERPSPDLEQGRQAIEATRALLPLASGDVAPIRDALTQLQVAYAQLAQSAERSGAASPTPAASEGRASESPGADDVPDRAAPPGGPGPGPAPASDPEREKVRPKIWTPPGA